MRKRSKTLKIKALKRDNFTCQKCGFQDKTEVKLEAHHVVPLYMEGKDDLNNLIILCFDCHHFAPDKKQEFDEYMKEECDGTSTTLLKVWQKVRQEHPELFNIISST